MEEQAIVISEIKELVASVLKDNKHQKATLEQMQSTVTELQAEKADLNAEISRLKDEQKVLKVAKAMEPGEKSTDAKLKINELVKEIDKCIALINN